MYNVHDTPLGLLSGMGEKNLQILSVLQCNANSKCIP